MTVFLKSTHQLLKDTIMHNIDQLLQNYRTTELYYQVREIAQRFLNDRMANATEASKHHLSMMTADFQTVNMDVIRELSENYFDKGNNGCNGGSDGESDGEDMGEMDDTCGAHSVSSIG